MVARKRTQRTDKATESNRITGDKDRCKISSGGDDDDVSPPKAEKIAGIPGDKDADMIQTDEKRTSDVKGKSRKRAVPLVDADNSSKNKRSRSSRSELQVIKEGTRVRKQKPGASKADRKQAPDPNRKTNQKSKNAPGPDSKTDQKLKNAPGPDSKTDQKSKKAPGPNSKADQKSKNAPGPDSKADQKSKNAPGPDSKADQKSKKRKGGKSEVDLSVLKRRSGRGNYVKTSSRPAVKETVESSVRDEEKTVLNTEMLELCDLKTDKVKETRSEDVGVQIDKDYADVGVMSSSESDEADDFEPVIKKTKVQSKTGSGKVSATMDRKSKILSNSDTKKASEKTKKTCPGRKRATKVKEMKQSSENKSHHDNKGMSKRRGIPKSKESSDNSTGESRKSATTSQKNIDHLNVMSVLLHMEGGREVPGSSGTVPGGQLSEGETDKDSEEESDWEEVKDFEGSPVKSQIPTDPVEVILEAPNILKKRKKREFDWKAYVQRQINRFNKTLREDIHKVHVMCLLMRGRYLNQMCNDLLLRGVALSLLPQEFSSVPPRKYDVTTHTRLVNWYKGTIIIDPSIAVTDDHKSNLTPETIVRRVEDRKVNSRLEFVLFYLVTLRCLGVHSRLVTSLQPLPLKNSKQGDLKDDCKKINIKGNPAAIKKAKKPNSKVKPAGQAKVEKRSKDKTDKRDRDHTEKTSKSGAQGTSKTLKTKSKNLRKRGSKVRPESYHDNSDLEDSGDDFEPEEDGCSGGRKRKTSDSSLKINESPDRSEEDFEEETQTFRSPLRKSISGKKKNQKILSSDSENDAQLLNQSCDEWVEVYIDQESSWICIDCLRGHINRPYRIESAATQPVHYVVAYSEGGKWKDVTARYASKWMTETRKLRVDPEWWEETLSVYRDKEDEVEDEEIKASLMKRPLPTSVSDYKSHPLYALRRHLLKFEAIYPETAAPLGYIRGEPVYARECVHELHSRENWLKEGRAVRIGEEAYKMVKSRAKWNKPKLDPDALDLELFGFWQTDVYIPPPAVD
ncbi:DNA repair protein complementing XP-C cells homolog isoform X2 [Ostrea edulis]|nr:DNA repair protein complementing XP-C cells homolog isoform X2 [Ostrea edulis]